MKLGVCVPYRNREEHLKEFVPRVAEYLRSQGIEDFHMYFCHQKDDKLFNRGATKNIAAKFAFEDGCDYIVWHDIDMIPEIGGGADYSYPFEHPIHIATNISQMNYDLKYFEYFGGAVLFTKDQVYRTNGYSNSYWDWGMEDDDLFWRCYLEGLVSHKQFIKYDKLRYAHFNGDNAYIEIPTRGTGLRNFTTQSHTVSILCRAFQQQEKQEIYLLGDVNRRYVEYPILRIPGYDYGFSFNNSKTLSLQCWNTFNQMNYMWLKRYDNQWSWITGVFDVENQKIHFYLNGVESNSRYGTGSESPMSYLGKLKNYGPQSIYLGTTPSVPENDIARWFKGDIAKVRIWKKALSLEEVQKLHYDIPYEDMVLDLDFSREDENIEYHNIEYREEDITVYDSIIPYRTPGRFTCLYHRDEGIVSGKFVKGETTARNERRYMLSMQQGKINYKEDGIKQVKYKLLGVDELAPWASMVNVEL